ncbi:hypothetical protein H2248_012278 [Termitomyces sp. 'cryptogamus']|nr:hypothetical protein H2248_012278 [Termitomyces sp. 'cryptogamus']
MLTPGNSNASSANPNGPLANSNTFSAAIDASPASPEPLGPSPTFWSIATTLGWPVPNAPFKSNPSLHLVLDFPRPPWTCLDHSSLLIFTNTIFPTIMQTPARDNHSLQKNKLLSLPTNNNKTSNHQPPSPTPVMTCSMDPNLVSNLLASPRMPHQAPPTLVHPLHPLWVTLTLPQQMLTAP